MMTVWLTLALVVTTFPSLAVALSSSFSIVGCFGIETYPLFELPDSDMLSQIEGKTFNYLYQDGTEEDGDMLTLTLSIKHVNYAYMDIHNKVTFGSLEWNKNHFVLHNLPEGVFGAHNGKAWLVPAYGTKNNLVLRTCRMNWFCREDMSYYLTSNLDDLAINTRTCKKGGGRLFDRVIIAGGYDADGENLSDVETFDTLSIPNLPFAGYSSTLSAVGTKLFACGGFTSDEDLDSCYRLDMSNSSPSWTLLRNNIPEKMFDQTASVIGDHIWLVYYNNLYDLDTVTEEFVSHKLPFSVTEYMCAVSNGTYTYISGVGDELNEIWMNSEASKPENWHFVANMSRDRADHGCLWLDNKMYMTGGDDDANDVDILDTDTHKVYSIQPLLLPRCFHVMIVLNGQPAIVGGQTCLEKAVDSIEIYNVVRERWEASSIKLKQGRSDFAVLQLRK